MIELDGQRVPRRILPDGRFAEVVPLTYGRARLYVAEHNPEVHGYYDDGW